MNGLCINNPGVVENSAAILASVFSSGRRVGARIMSGDDRTFGLSPNGMRVYVPYPLLSNDWSLRTLTCGVALQCSPSKERLLQYPLHELTNRQQQALLIVEGGVSLSWTLAKWPGLGNEFERQLPRLEKLDPDMDGSTMLESALRLAKSSGSLPNYALLGKLPKPIYAKPDFVSALRRLYGRLPWSNTGRFSASQFSLPAGGDGNIQNPNLPPSTRPENDNPEIKAGQRAGIPYPEWNVWTRRLLPNYVAVLERKATSKSETSLSVPANLNRWFEAHTHRIMKNRLEDGSDIDVDHYIDQYADVANGTESSPRVFRDLVPGIRDVTTAVLLDGSASLGVQQGRVFKLELACSDALSRAMTLARERHGLFVFTGHTRHRVDVTCLKDFTEHHMVLPSQSGLATGGYTRLGAPIRHLTRRLVDQRSKKHLLIMIGDGLMSDEGYEGYYAWADVAHAVEEAEDAGVLPYYIGVGPARVDPLPDVFGVRRSMRIKRVEELPQVLARVHQQLLAA